MVRHEPPAFSLEYIVTAITILTLQMFLSYTAVSGKVVQKKGKSVRDNAER